MTRAQQHLTLLALLSSLYLLTATGLLPLPLSPIAQAAVVPVLPFWALVSFGAFLLARLGWGVLTFNDVPEAHAELMAQIGRAKGELRARGVEVGL